MALTTYPLNNIEYSAEDAELFHVTRTSGVYAKNSFDYSVTGADNTIVINTGIGWIKNSEFSGKVIALKERISLDMGLPDSVYPRIDAIVIQFDANMNATNIIVKNGTASSKPIPPEVSRDETVYELHLYHVKREAGSLSITPSNITDLRLNSSYCGLMADSVTSIDTSAIEKQVADLIKSLQNEISNVKDGSAYLLRDGSTNMTGNLPMDGHKVTGLGTPTANDDAVPKSYVDSLITIGTFYGDIDDIEALPVNSVAWLDPNATNNPVSDYGFLETWGSKSIRLQRFTRYLYNTVLQRKRVNGVWSAWVNPALEAYPVGAIYISTVSTSPASLFGGTWEQLYDRFLVGAGNTYTAGAKAGATTETHKHLQASGFDGSTFYGVSGIQGNTVSTDGGYIRQDGTANPIFLSHTYEATTDNMPPYLAVYMWKRTA